MPRRMSIESIRSVGSSARAFISGVDRSISTSATSNLIFGPEFLEVLFT